MLESIHVYVKRRLYLVVVQKGQYDLGISLYVTLEILVSLMRPMGRVVVMIVKYLPGDEM